MHQQSSRLVRRPDDGMIAGVAAGVAAHYHIDVTLVRIVFVALGIVTGGFAVLLYLAAAVIMPRQDDEPGFDSLKHGVDDLVTRGRGFYDEGRRAVDARRQGSVTESQPAATAARQESDLEL
jgi:phage shock protein C